MFKLNKDVSYQKKDQSSFNCINVRCCYNNVWTDSRRTVNGKPEQLNPSPTYPGIQEQETLPGVLMQMAFALQVSLFTAHSSTSVSQCNDTLLWLVIREPFSIPGFPD